MLRNFVTTMGIVIYAEFSVRVFKGALIPWSVGQIVSFCKLGSYRLGCNYECYQI